MSKSPKKRVSKQIKVDNYEFEPNVKAAIEFGVEMGKFVTRDSGARKDFESGMRRDTDEGKPRYDLIEPRMLKRWAELMARGAVKYSEDNWKLADSVEELKRFKASAFRHFMQWFNGENPEEDHAVAIMFNVTATEYLMEKIGTDIDGSFWTSIPGINNYEASYEGKIRRIGSKEIKPWKNKWGYCLITTSGEAKRHYQVHRLVASAFIGEVPGLQINHKDGIKTNNRVDNLEYVTAAENIRHSFEMGLSKPRTNGFKLDYDKAEEIRLRIDDGEKQKDLAKEFSVTVATINDIIKGRIWKTR